MTAPDPGLLDEATGTTQLAGLLVQADADVTLAALPGEGWCPATHKVTSAGFPVRCSLDVGHAGPHTAHIVWPD